MRSIKLSMLLLASIVAAMYITPPAYGQDEDQAEQQQTNQQEEKSQKTESTKSQNQTTEESNSGPVHAYRLEFTVSEFEDGKKINTRSYSFLARVGMMNKLRIGGGVRVHTGPPNSSEWQYIDIAMNIDCTVEERQGLAVLNTTFDSSSMAAEHEPQTQQPVIRQMMSVVRSVVTPGKPTLITSMDDPTSRARFEIDVIATKAH